MTAPFGQVPSLAMQSEKHSKLCLDVQYTDTTATVAGVVFAEWSDSLPLHSHTIVMPTPGEYEPGAFYKRELPCLLKLIDQLPESPGLIIIDGYVWLGPDRPGLGHHLYQALNQQVPVIGVAKTFFDAGDQVRQVFRGESKRPLYVTAAGISVAEAAIHIQSMHGEHRMPTLLKLADQLARGHANP